MKRDDLIEIVHLVLIFIGVLLFTLLMFLNERYNLLERILT